MEIERSTHIAFAYTIKNLGTDLDADYSPFFTKLRKFGIKSEFNIKEFDSKGKAHYHGILYLQKGFFRKRIMIKGYHIKLKELQDRDGWVKYIHKDIHWQDYEDYVPQEEDEKIEMPTRRLF